MSLYPLRFEPIFQTYLWGGRRLGSELNKPIGDGPTWAESWELVDHGEYQSQVLAGELAGSKLGNLVERFGSSLLGESTFQKINAATRPSNLIGRFPLLFKFLDANRNLSVQVHPDDEMGRTLSPPDLGKTEAWYVVDAMPGSKVYAGLKAGIKREELRAAIETNTAESVLHSFEPVAGDCIFIPAGTVHALGEGLLIAEIQQCSNTTFRLYDWGRVDSDGQPRELHIEKGIEATNFSLGPVNKQSPVSMDQYSESIVSCDQFELRRFRENSDLTLPTAGSFKLLVVIDGDLRIKNDPSELPLNKGQTCLLPADLEQVEIEVLSETTFLWISPE